MKLSIISPIMCLNEELADMTRRMIDDIRKGMIEECEFVIVDNASTQAVDDMISGADIYIRSSKNLGWGGGLNMGMKLASGEYFVFVNNDVTVKPGWAEQLIDRFMSKEKIGAISMNSKGGFGGSFFAIRKTIYEKIGGFDEENFPLGHAQDCDYLYRLMYEGWDDNVLLIEGFEHYGRRTYEQIEFKTKYLQHPNFAKSDFVKKWGFREVEWEKRGHLEWEERVLADPTLDRFNEFESIKKRREIIC